MTPQNQNSPALMAARCSQCGHVDFPPSSICTACASRHSRESVELGPIGILYTYTVVHVAAPDMDTPYALGYVDFPEGVRLFGRIFPPENLSLGMKVRLASRDVRSLRFEPAA